MSTLLQPRRAPQPLRRAAMLATITLTMAGLLAWTPTITAAWNQSAAEASLWQLTNSDRVNNGLRPIQQNGTLVGIARWRSKDMVVNDYFSHNIPACGGCLVFHYYDTNGLSYAWAGENIGWNSGYADGDSPVAVNNAFMNSPEHRGNILNRVWTHGGVGAYGEDNITWQGKSRSPRLYTELFMQAKSAAPPAPKPTPKPLPKPVPPQPAPAAPRPAATPKPKSTAKPASKPAATQQLHPVPLGALAVMRSGDRWLMGPGYLLAREPFEREALDGSVQLVAYRVEDPPPVERGFIETVLGTLLGFVL